MVDDVASAIAFYTTHLGFTEQLSNPPAFADCGAGSSACSSAGPRALASTLVSVILGNVRSFEAGEGGRRFERGSLEAQAKGQDILTRLRSLPDGEQKAVEAKRMIDRVRTFAGCREHPKYVSVSRYLIYKQALLEEAERLVQADLLRGSEDVFYLSFYLSIPEVRKVAAGTPVDDRIIAERRRAFASYGALTPPRVLTSDGEAVPGKYRRGHPTVLAERRTRVSIGRPRLLGGCRGQGEARTAATRWRDRAADWRVC